MTVFAGCLNFESPGAKELKAKCSSRLHVVQMDVTKIDEIKKVKETVAEILGKKNGFVISNIILDK